MTSLSNYVKIQWDEFKQNYSLAEKLSAIHELISFFELEKDNLVIESALKDNEQPA